MTISNFTPPQAPNQANNLILFIGDGMGQAHRFAAQLLIAGPHGRLTMDRLPYFGMMGTLSRDYGSFVTDSAAAATALATGVKTYNGAISVDLEGRRPNTILEAAQRAGKATGLVTTCQITDATPAAFGAHVPNRADHSEIARQYIEAARIDVILGGGAAYWYPPGASTGIPPETSEVRLLSQGTAGDLAQRARQLGYRAVSTAPALELAASARDTTQLLGLFANQELFRQRAEGQGDAYDPPVTLAEMTRAALDVLSRNRDGFFLMVEESAIDRMAHRNNGRLTLKGVLELDLAVQVALDYAARDPSTLIIVAADHECGGLAVAGSDDPAYPYEPDGSLIDASLAGEDGPFPVAGTDFAFVMGWATTGHTAAAVPVTSIGPGAEQLTGLFDNTELFGAMARALGFEMPDEKITTIAPGPLVSAGSR
jgi:alkaline phosphatase